jgi:hypothetical protein
MQRSLLLTAALVVAGLAAVHAQQTTNDANPLYRYTSIRMGTIIVPPITGAPFSATAIIKNQQILADGSLATTRNINLIGRDSRGRTHGEMRPRMPEASRGMPPLSEVHLFDPQTRMRIVYYPATHIASRQLQHEAPASTGISSLADPLVKVENLGFTNIDGIEAEGTRRTLTIAAQVNGTGAPLTVIDEYWYSEDLHLNVLLMHNDPRTGLQTVALTDVKREEPDRAFFEVPEGYKIVDMTPPSVAPEVSSRAVSGSPAR